MDNFFAFLKKYYTNIYTRNGILIIIALSFSLLTNSFRSPEDKVNPFSLTLLNLTNIIMIIVYNHYILRLFLFRKKYVLFLVLFGVYMAFITLFTMYITRPLLNKSFISDFAVFLPDIIFNTFLISFFYFLHYNFLKYIKVNEIQILNHQTEIEYLKQQVNPHFLLNSLNNLYGVSLTNPSEVPNKIIELADLLKYQIETIKKEYNSLENEKEFIEKYIGYSKWKLQNISIKSAEIGSFKNYKITPMLFLPLIENAVKYANLDKNPMISILWEFGDSKFDFTITNNFTNNKNEKFSTKTGLLNLQKRLSLFHPDSKLTVEENTNNFKVVLSLWNLNIHA
ncbi:MAG TPA: histidine kinase [Saprospiraceae bacterium]|nr:histidine kinase [Saprospiraceae bacterium]